MDIDNLKFVFDIVNIVDVSISSIGELDIVMFEKLLTEYPDTKLLLKYFSECHLRAESFNSNDKYQYQYKQIVHIQLRNYILINDTSFSSQLILSVDDEFNHYFNEFLTFLDEDDTEESKSCLDTIISDVDYDSIDTFKIKFFRDLFPNVDITQTMEKCGKALETESGIHQMIDYNDEKLHEILDIYISDRSSLELFVTLNFIKY